MNRTSWTPIFVCAAMALGLAWGQDDKPKPPAGVPVFEYRVLAWDAEDTKAALQDATDDQVSDVSDMLTELATEIEPLNHPKLQAAINRRLSAELGRAGLEGWELAWTRESTSVVSGFVVPAPAVFLKRRLG